MSLCNGRAFVQGQDHAGIPLSIALKFSGLASAPPKHASCKKNGTRF
jgi:hypothetical protein